MAVGGPTRAPHHHPGAMILVDQPCAGCGYNLIGLHIGTNCPECGRRIAIASVRWTHETLAHAPVPYVRALAAGFTLMSLGVVALPMAAPAAALGWTGFRWPWVAVPAAWLWWVGLAVVCRPRPGVGEKERDKREWLWMRVVALGTQACLPAAAMLWLIWDSMPAPAAGAGTTVRDIVGGLAVGLAILGALGWAPTAVLLARYADWASDTSLAQRLRNAAWGIVVLTALIVVGAALPAAWGGLIFDAFGWLLVIGLVGSVAMYFLSAMGLANLCWATVRYARSQQARDRRMVEKMIREREEHAAKTHAEPQFEPPSLVHRVASRPSDWEERKR